MLSQAGNVCGYERRESSESPGETGDLHAESVKLLAVGNAHGPRFKMVLTLQGSKHLRPFQGRINFGMVLRGRCPRLFTISLSG